MKRKTQKHGRRVTEERKTDYREMEKSREECGMGFSSSVESCCSLHDVLGQENTHIYTHTHTHTHTETAQIMQFSAAHACRRFLPSSAAPATTTKTAKSWFNTNSRATKAQMGGETEWKELSGVYHWTNALNADELTALLLWKPVSATGYKIKKASLTIQRHKSQNSEFLHLKIGLFF